MKYPTHGNLSIDQWRQMSQEFEFATTIPIVRAFESTANSLSSRKESKLIPTMAGFAAVAGVYAAVPALVVVDGPLPFGDAIAVGLLAIPDAAIFAFGYSLFD